LSKKLLEEIERPLNERSTTITWLNRQKREVAEQRLWEIMEHNIQGMYNLVEYVGGLPDDLRMVRIGSNILPAYTEQHWSYYWQEAGVRRYCESQFSRVGALARSLDVRLSFHPGQFVVLASDRPDVFNRSIEEFEYHTDMLRWMGYGKTFQDFKCNVHIAGKKADLLAEHSDTDLPDMHTLLETGYKKGKLRAHSDTYWNSAVNDWAWTFTEDFDIMCESKHKQLASIGFYNQMSGNTVSTYK
jgi:hypothetical protein